MISHPAPLFVKNASRLQPCDLAAGRAGEEGQTMLELAILPSYKLMAIHFINILFQLDDLESLPWENGWKSPNIQFSSEV